MSQELLNSLAIFTLAILVGFEVISKVPATLHTPLMSGANSIHGIVLVGAMFIAAEADNPVSYTLAFIALSQAVRHIPVGIAYAMWAGLGTAAVVAIGAVFLGEALSVTKVVGLVLVVGGVVVLNLGGAH